MNAWQMWRVTLLLAALILLIAMCDAYLTLITDAESLTISITGEYE